MSRAAWYGTLIAAVAASQVASCSSQRDEDADFVRPKSPVRVNFSCENGNNTISLTDMSGNNSAWEVDMDGRKISWRVPNNVTINAIRAKPGKNLPIENDGPNHGGSKGVQYDAKAKPEDQDGPKVGDRLSYTIELTCEISPGNVVKLSVDPEMIVR